MNADTGAAERAELQRQTALTIDVIGTPAAQGSKIANRFGHGVRDANDKTLRPWRAEVAGTVATTMAENHWTTLDGPIEVELTFLHPRIASHYGTGRNQGRLKPSAPHWKATAPDIDKLTRAVLDALTAAAAIRDDARVARLVVEDQWANEWSGVRIKVSALTQSTVPVRGGEAGAGAVQSRQEALL